MMELEALKAAIPGALGETALPLEGKYEGKVRDSYRLDEGRRLLVTTDRVSAFDRVLGAVPFKGQVLNQLSAWWFGRLAEVVPHHMISVPDPNVMIAHEAAPLPVEVVVRGYLTGSTSTSLWTMYSQGVERPYGLDLPAGMKKHQALPQPVITPTTKAPKGQHDEQLSCAQVVSRGLVEPELWAQVERAALAVFARGQALAAEAGLILVDTKYEFGLIGGRLALIDEVHTPDSSRYWMAEGYEEALAQGGDPRAFDKEHLRLWLGQQGYKGDGPPPPLDPDVVAEVARRYIWIYERLTGSEFVPGALPARARVEAWGATVR
jgi:phosphoribosylaminoimidazole-succinocarboxamide synthase